MLDGLHVHIGSQILDLEPFRLALRRVAALQRELAGAGHAIASVDVGGGLGVRYRAGPDGADRAGGIRRGDARGVRRFRRPLVLEPGRYLVAEAGVLMTRVMRVKQGGAGRILVVDAAMNDLRVRRCTTPGTRSSPLDGGRSRATRYDVVGPVCETGDTFAASASMPRCEAGDLLC